MKHFINYFKHYKLATFLAPFFKLLEALIDLLVPLIVAKLIDEGIANNNQSYINNCIILLVVLAIVGLGFSICGQFFAAKAAVGVSSKMKLDLFKKSQRLAQKDIERIGPSTLVNRMTSDMNQIQNGINLVLRLFLRSPFIVFGAAILALYISASASISFWIVIPILTIIVFGVTLITIPKYRKNQEMLDDVLNSTKENLTGIRVIRAFGSEDSEMKKYSQKTKELKSKQKHASNISALLNPLTYVVINLAICYLLYIGAIKVDMGSLTQGEVIALYNFMSQILVELIKLANLIITITKSLASIKRVQYIILLDSKLTYDNTLKGDNSAFIVFDDVSLKYENSKSNSLNHITFKINKNETIGIIGGTGSGKSSIVNLLPHFHEATSGNIYIDGKNILSYKENELREKFGVVFQKPSIFKGTIKSNISFGRDFSDSDINEALDIAQAKVIAHNKGGIDGVSEQQGRNFSGGEKQRLSIARAVVAKPEILILDDSSSALDYATDKALREEIKKLDTTVIIMSERASSVIECDRIIVLENGEIDNIGTHKELLEKSKIYQEIYYSQFEKESDE